MLKTATPNSHSFGSESAATSSGSDSQPRHGSLGAPRTFLDVFNPPLDPAAIAGASPGSSPALGTPSSMTASHSVGSSHKSHPDVSCSPANYPTSFAAHALQEHGSFTSPTSSATTIGIVGGGQSPSLVFRGIPASPVINIRKTSSSATLNRDLEDFHLGESLSAKHGGAGDIGGSHSGVLHHQHHYHHYHHGHSPRAGAYSPRMNQRRQMSMSEITHEDLYAPATTEEIRNPELLAKHHSPSNAGTTSPQPPSSAGTGSATDRRASIQDLIVPVVPIEETTISSSIPLYEVPQDMLVPLLDRPNDMKRLLAHQSCDKTLHVLRNVLGDETFDGELMKLWTETDRKDVPDAEWLWRTKCLILKCTGGGGVGAREEKLWGDFCDMVGFDEEEFDTSIEREKDENRPGDKDTGTPVEQMEKIGEEEEPAEPERERKE